MAMRRWCVILILSMLTSGVGGCALRQQIEVWLMPPTPTRTVTVTQGQIRDAVTGEPVSGVQLRTGTVTALSDVEGAFSVPSLSGQVISLTAPGYEGLEIQPRPGFPLAVDLVPDAERTFAILFEYEKRHEYGRQYDLLHPDVQALFTRDSYIRYMEQQRPYDIVAFTVGEAKLIASGNMMGRVYRGVQQVPVQATVREQGEVKRQAWVAYAAKADRLWRWLRGPLIWPTPSPIASPTASVTMTDLPPETATPTTRPPATLTPLPTPTPSPTLGPSPTPYTPMAPGQAAVVIVSVAPLRAGPGEQYGVTWGMHRGTVLTMLEWPRWVEGVPWYRVQLSDSGLAGWCEGTYLAPLAATLTPLPTWTTLPGATSRIAFTSERDGDREVYVMAADGTGLRNLTGHPAQDSDPSWGPQRGRVVFASDRSGSNNIFVMNVDGSGLAQLTYAQSDQIHPAWSPNGAFIAYVSNEDGDWEICVMNASGAGAVQLTSNEAWDSYPAWSPDSRTVVYTSGRDGDYELYQYDLATRSEARLTSHPASDAFPSWSPDGSRIAFTSARDGQLDLYALDPTSDPPQVTRLTHSSSAQAANRYPSWSNDGHWLAFTSWRDGNAEVYVVHRDSWGLTRLTTHTATDESPAWND
jgi:Tol biopolymer transport system component